MKSALKVYNFFTKKRSFSKIRVNPLSIYLMLGFFALPAMSTIFSGLFTIILIVLFCLLFAFFFVVTKPKDYTFFVIFPLIISCFQNVILGIFSPQLTAESISYLLSLGLVYGLTLLLSLIYLHGFQGSFKKKCLFLLILLLVYSVFISLITHFSVSTFASGFRNLSAPILYLLIGLYSAREIKDDKLLKYFIFIFLTVFLFGLYEIIIDKNVWTEFNIKDLRTKKGIDIEDRILPGNFYSSELIFGNQIRRMSSTFADPVNLGTFFAFTTVYFYYKKRHFLFLCSLIGIVLTVSKGGLLTFLIFLIIAFYSKKNKTRFLVVCGLCAVAAILFLMFSFNSSTQSVAAHLSGFFNSFGYMMDHPFGSGVGNVGTLSFVVTGNVEAQSIVLESGFGMILGQLGIFGLVFYVFYFLSVLIRIFKLNITTCKFLLTLLLAILANIMFNEVALSPNSCGIYFLMIGLNLFKDLKPVHKVRTYKHYGFV